MIGIAGSGTMDPAVAYRLQNRSYDVRALEVADSLGGLAATYETNDDDIERFYHYPSKSEETIVELAAELSPEDDLEWRIGKNAYYADGVVHPPDTAWQIAAYPHMSLYDKFRFGTLTLGVDVYGGIPDFDAYGELAEYGHTSIEEFVVEHTTRGVYDNLVDPFLDGKFGKRKRDVSASWFLGRVRSRGKRGLLRGGKLGYFDGGFAPSIDALVEAVGREYIETDARVTGFDTDGEAVSTLTVETDDGTETREVELVAAATMSNVFEGLTGFPCDIDLQRAVCGLAIMSESLMNTYWLNIAHDASFGPFIEHMDFVSEERYGGDHLLYVASYVQGPYEELRQMSDEEVEDAWSDETEEMLPDLDRSAVEEFKIARNPHAGPVYERGYLDFVIPCDLGNDVVGGVYYARMVSEAQYPERLLNGGIVTGYEVADRIDRS